MADGEELKKYHLSSEFSSPLTFRAIRFPIERIQVPIPGNGHHSDGRRRRSADCVTRTSRSLGQALEDTGWRRRGRNIADMPRVFPQAKRICTRHEFLQNSIIVSYYECKSYGVRSLATGSSDTCMLGTYYLGCICRQGLDNCVFRAAVSPVQV